MLVARRCFTRRHERSVVFGYHFYFGYFCFYSWFSCSSAVLSRCSKPSRSTDKVAAPENIHNHLTRRLHCLFHPSAPLDTTLHSFTLSSLIVLCRRFYFVLSSSAPRRLRTLITSYLCISFMIPNQICILLWHAAIKRKAGKDEEGRTHFGPIVMI